MWPLFSFSVATTPDNAMSIIIITNSLEKDVILVKFSWIFKVLALRSTYHNVTPTRDIVVGDSAFMNKQRDTIKYIGELI